MSVYVLYVLSVKKKKNQKKTRLEVGFLGGFFWVLLGGFFIANPAVSGQHLGISQRNFNSSQTWATNGIELFLLLSRFIRKLPSFPENGVLLGSTPC
jgi:hypothetical protein